ncbi:nicotinate (nicotinamide) nucleotide adenylyltransferase [bacterium]|jgi:nicotinate-nucleotide adenylyltransferase|nr:nicotinate (nicotinamide) nucleotide adenylyltransferase [bacterium]
MKLNDVTAVFGGSFDPPHLGHTAAVQGLFQDPGVARVFIVPSARPPHKTSLKASTEHRIAMTRLAFSAGHPENIRIDLREIERNQRTQTPSYSYDTLKELHSEMDPSKLAFVIGADQLPHLHEWHRFPDVLGLCHWIVLDRRPTENLSLEKTLRDWQASGIVKSQGFNIWQLRSSNSSNSKNPLTLQLVHTEAPPISSTMIRQSLERTGEPPANSLHPEVAAYLKTHHLYGTHAS